MHLNPDAEKHTNTCFQLVIPGLDASWVTIQADSTILKISNNTLPDRHTGEHSFCFCFCAYSTEMNTCRDGGALALISVMPTFLPLLWPSARTKYTSWVLLGKPAHTWVLTAENCLTASKERQMASCDPDCPTVLWVSDSDTKIPSSIKDVGVSFKDLFFKGPLWTFQALIVYLKASADRRLTSVSALRNPFCTGFLLEGMGFLLEGVGV